MLEAIREPVLKPQNTVCEIMSYHYTATLILNNLNIYWHPNHSKDWHMYVMANGKHNWIIPDESMLRTIYDISLYRVSQKEVPSTLDQLRIMFLVYCEKNEIVWKPHCQNERLNTTTLEPSSPRLCIEMYTLCSRIYQYNSKPFLNSVKLLIFWTFLELVTIMFHIIV